MHHEKIEEHSEKLAKIEVILDRVATNQDSMTSSVQTMAHSLTKLELIMEKVSNLEVNFNSSVGRVHERIDKEIEVREEKIDDINKKLKLLDPFLVLARYPKTATTIALMLYAFAISDIRHDVLESIPVTIAHKEDLK